MIGLVVDGFCEQGALPKRILEKCVVRRRNSNGNAVSLVQIANESVGLLRALEGRRCRKLIIVMDREDRTISAQDMVSQLVTLISARTPIPFKLIVADRMFENWLLADIEGISARYSGDFSAARNSAALEGTNGKSRFKQVMKRPFTYCPEIAKKYFSSIRPAVAVTNSDSFKSWVDALNALGILHR